RARRPLARPRQPRVLEVRDARTAHARDAPQVLPAQHTAGRPVAALGEILLSQTHPFAQPLDACGDIAHLSWKDFDQTRGRPHLHLPASHESGNTLWRSSLPLGTGICACARVRTVQASDRETRGYWRS